MIRLLAFLFYLGILFGQDKGKKAYKEGHYDEARIYYEHVLKNRKKDDGAQYGLGVTAYQQKDMETAARALNNAMNSDNKSLASKAMYNLGNMFRDQQKMEESLALYRKAIELDPTDEDAKVNYELLKQVLQQQEQQQQQDEQNQEQDRKKERINRSKIRIQKSRTNKIKTRKNRRINRSNRRTNNNLNQKRKKRKKSNNNPKKNKTRRKTKKLINRCRLKLY